MLQSLPVHYYGFSLKERFHWSEISQSFFKESLCFLNVWKAVLSQPRKPHGWLQTMFFARKRSMIITCIKLGLFLFRYEAAVVFTGHYPFVFLFIALL